MNGVQIREDSEAASPLHNTQDAVNAIGEALSHSAEVIAVRAESLDPKFFQLRSGMTGEIVQKFVNYRLKLAIIGDFSQAASESAALRDLSTRLIKATRFGSWQALKTLPDGP